MIYAWEEVQMFDDLSSALWKNKIYDLESTFQS